MINIPSLRPETRYGIPPADHLLFNRQYIIGYSYLLRQAKWALELIDLNNRVDDLDDRIDSFRPDYRIPEKFRANLADYKRSGFDRGHLVASANRQESELLNSETFLLTNMSPQHADLNRDIWRRLEQHIRDLCGLENIVEVYTICGPLFRIGEKIEVIGFDPDNPNDVVIPVPHSYFKSILAEDVKGKIKIWTFVFPNEDCPDPLKDYQRSTSYVEKWAGLPLWDRLTGKEANRIKDKMNELWF